MTSPLVVIGAGGHASSIIDIILASSEWHVGSIVGTRMDLGKEILGHKCSHTDQDLPSLSNHYTYAVIAIGQIGLSPLRKSMEKKLTAYGFKLPPLISPFSYTSNYSSIGLGTVISHGAIVNSNVSIGSCCIINSCSLVEHDSNIGGHCHISTGALINGGVSIGSGSFIGSGAIIREGLSLPCDTIIGAGKRIMGWPSLE